MQNPISISAFRGGETFALERLKKVLEEIEEYHERLKKTKNYHNHIITIFTNIFYMKIFIKLYRLAILKWP